MRWNKCELRRKKQNVLFFCLKTTRLDRYNCTVDNLFTTGMNLINFLTGGSTLEDRYVL